jgi:hypothetical protein
MRTAWRPPHLMLGVHPAMQQSLYGAFGDRRGDWLLAPPGRRIVNDDIGLLSVRQEELLEKELYNRQWKSAIGVYDFEIRASPVKDPVP